MPYSQYFSCPRLAADRLWCPVPLQERHPVLSQGIGYKRRCPAFKRARSIRQRAFSFPAEQEDFTILASPSLEPQVSYGFDDLDDDEPERALLVGVGEANRGRRQGPTYSLDDSLEELGGLAEAAGLKVVGSMTQHIQPDAQTYLGPGKVEEMLQMVATVGADTIIFDGELTPRQLRNLSRRCSQRICDRTALILEFVQEEQRLLPEQLLALPSNIAAYTPFTAASEAKGVSDNRLQNVVITLDKVKLCLNKPGQCQNAPLRLLAESEVAEYLWTGTKSVARRLLRAAASELASPTVARALSSAEDADDIQEVLAKHRGQKHLEEVAVLVTQPAADAAEARSRLMALAEKMRALDVALGGGHTAAADMLLLFASTQTWFTSERDYKGFTSPPVKLNLSDLMLKRAVGPGVAAVPRKDQAPPPSMGLSEAVAQDSAPLADAHMATAMTASGEATAEALTAVVEGEEAGGAGQAADAVLSVGPPASVGTQKAKASKGAASRRNGPEKQSKVGLAKRYGAGFVWGQLNGWYKQTVFDPTASLSAERRGTISLPDIESCYGGARSRYTVKDRNHLIDHIEKRPEGLWKIGTNWSFRNEGKIYGSPMFDAIWAETVADAPANPMPEVLRKLKSAHLPRASENARAPAEEDSY